MIRIYYILLMLLCCTLFPACSSEDAVTNEQPVEGIGAIVPTKFLDGINDPSTRSALSLVGNSMVYTWMDADQIGVFNVGVEGSASLNTPFTYKSGTERHENSITYARFQNVDYSFSKQHWWVAYAPYNCVANEQSRTKVLNYEEISLSYEGQKAFYNATPSGFAPNAAKEKNPDSYNSTTESRASSTLADYDYLISAPAQPDDDGLTTFKFSHVGSTVRFWVQFPDGAFGGRGKCGYIKSMDLLCTSSKIVKGVKLKINKQPNSASTTTPYYSEIAQSKVTTQKLTLNLPGTDGHGIELPDVEGGCNFINYMEFYPTNFVADECYLYLTVMVDGVETYFKSESLPARDIVAGKLYQWHPNLNTPIMLTATLQSWKDIVSGGISTDLEQ